jgi:hypothetical protein
MKQVLLPLPRARSGRLRDGLRPGQAVEVSRGTLAGLSGVLVGCTGGSRWTVQLDGVRGALVVIDAIALTARRRGA